MLGHVSILSALSNSTHVLRAVGHYGEAADMSWSGEVEGCMGLREGKNLQWDGDRDHAHMGFGIMRKSGDVAASFS